MEKWFDRLSLLPFWSHCSCIYIKKIIIMEEVLVCSTTYILVLMVELLYYTTRTHTHAHTQVQQLNCSQHIACGWRKHGKYAHTHTCANMRTPSTHYHVVIPLASSFSLISLRAACSTVKDGIPCWRTLSCCCSHAASISLMQSSFLSWCSLSIVCNVE